MARYGMVVDISKCNGCYNCFLACKDEFCGNEYLPYSTSQPMIGQYWMNIIERERGQYPKVKVAYIPVPCMHCENPVCIKAAQDGAIYKREDGIVIIDPEKAKGHKELINACPYRVIFWNEEKQVAQKCTMCAHLLDKGYKEPRCVEACPTAALVFGDLDDPKSSISKIQAERKTEILHPEYKMSEKVMYIGLPKRFVAGAVVLGDKDDCAEGAIITLTCESGKKTVKADNYGDFEFENLPVCINYQIKIEFEGYESQILYVNTNIDQYLGDIVLTKTGT